MKPGNFRGRIVLNLKESSISTCSLFMDYLHIWFIRFTTILWLWKVNLFKFIRKWENLARLRWDLKKESIGRRLEKRKTKKEKKILLCCTCTSINILFVSTSIYFVIVWNKLALSFVYLFQKNFPIVSSKK